jgi:hypothetical protein
MLFLSINKQHWQRVKKPLNKTGEVNSNRQILLPRKFQADKQGFVLVEECIQELQ